jgi:hypothetical protein
MKLLISIVPKNLTDDLAALIAENQIDFQTTVPGNGTATSDILEYLSLDPIEKDVVFSLVEDADIPVIFGRMVSDFDFLKKGMGVAFTISLDSISKAGHDLLKNVKEEEKTHGKH